MSEWTDEQQRAMGYELDPDHPANLTVRDRLNRQIDANAAAREAGLPCAASAGQPLEQAEPVRPRTEVERLFPDAERVRKTQEAIATLRGILP